MTSEFSKPRQGIYLLSHSIGLLPKTTQQHLADVYFDPWSECDEGIWPSWLSALDGFRQSVADLLHTDKSLVCPQSNLSSALTKVFNAIPRIDSQKKTILLTEEDFPSLGFVLDKARDQGMELKFIPRGADMRDVSLWESYLTDDVFAVLFSHVQSNTGLRLPIADLTSLSRDRDIFSVVDIAQSAGIVPINVNEWSADVVLGSCVKWLCGGPGAGFLWVDSTTLETLEPEDVGWFSHKLPFEFDIHHFEYADDALKFWGGTPSVAPFVIAANGIETLLQVGIEHVWSHNSKLKSLLINAIDPSLLASPRALEAQGGTIIVKDSSALQHALAEANVKFDTRPHGIRLSPHIYNDASECEHVGRLINDLTR